MSRRRAAAAVAVVAGLAAAAAAAAQPVVRADEDLDFDRPEAWAMKYFTTVSLASGFGPPAPVEPGSVALSFEVGWIPEISAADAQVGFAGTKREDVNKAPVLARPRLDVGLPADWTLTLGYVPPVEVFDAKAHLLSASLGRPLWERGAWRAGGRVYGQLGTVESDITCPDEVAARGDDLAANPFRCEEPSSDVVDLRYAGLELALARDGGGGVVPHLALGIDHLDMAFEVDALTSGFRDRSRLTAEGTVWHAAAGLTWRPVGSPARLGVELFYVPLSVDRAGTGGAQNDPLFNVRFTAAYRVR